MKTYSLTQVTLTLSSLFLAWSLMESRAADDAALKQVFKGHFLVGAALNQSQFTGSNAAEVAIIDKHFDTTTPENALKWEAVNPKLGKFDFGRADQYVDFGEKHGMFIIGHNLVWHNQTPKWVFEDDKGEALTRDALLARMREHIATVVGRYKGRIKGWDVVNEALNEDGALRQSKWRKIIGDDYLVKAYQFAHEADPDAELYYNDFSIENAPKRAGAIRLVKDLQAHGVKIAAVGVQGHYDLLWPSTNLLDEALTDLSKLGVKLMITELDVNVLRGGTRGEVADLRRSRSRRNPYPDGLPAEMQQKLADRYADIFKIFLKHAEIQRITFWGVTDGDSWLNWPGVTNYPLLFGRDFQPKPAFDAVVKAATEFGNEVVTAPVGLGAKWDRHGQPGRR